MGIYHYSVSNKSFRTGDNEEIRFAENHGKAWAWSHENADRWESRYDRAVNRTRDLHVLFVECGNKSELAACWNLDDNEDRRQRFGNSGVPVYRTPGDGTGWSEEYEGTEPVGFLFPASGSPTARTQWTLLTPGDLGL